MITLTAAHNAYQSKSKAYVARITGRDSKFTFAREFISRGGRDRQDATADVDTTGLYELRSVDKKDRTEDTYILLIECDGKLIECDADKADAMAVAKALDAGRQFNSIVSVDADGFWSMQTEKQAKKTAVAATIDSVTEACWQQLQHLPEKQAKAVMAALKKRVTPPKPAAVVGLTEDAPIGVVALESQEAPAVE